MTTALARRCRIIAEGDSWFAFPPSLGGNTITQLERQLAADGMPVAMVNLANNGDEARQIMSRTQHERLYNLLGDPALQPDFLLFSAGGNDLVGEQFSLWLKHQANTPAAAQALHPDRVTAILGVIEAAYRELFAIRDSRAPNCWIISHEYAIPFATGVGVCGNRITGYAYGPWLKRELDYRGWISSADQRAILTALLVKFSDMLRGFEAAVPRFKFARTQQLLLNASDWHDELHPDGAGFQAVATEFAKLIRATPWP